MAEEAGEIVAHDLDKAKQEDLLKKNGFRVAVAREGWGMMVLDCHRPAAFAMKGLGTEFVMTWVGWCYD